MGWVGLAYLLKKRESDYKENIEEAQLPVDWDSVISNVHPELASYTSFKDLKKDTLYIQVSDSFLISELEARKESIKQELNKKRKKPISLIKFTL